MRPALNMEQSNLTKLLLVLFSIIFTANLATTPGQTNADPELSAAIAKIKAIDNHAHPLRFVASGEKPDDEFDALPLDAIGPIPLPVRLSPGNLEFVQAWRDLYGYKHADLGEAHVREL